ncbi:GguC protein [Alloacidobacterium dinghuense]|uniref:GguC protein n=1 Tax=Alloacidobacterium dinghuense TaxID=2763107 RepID=A0A7G8BLX4_9BACT|nr:AraD1 family protein [Alloacidobacterium dinghuense]QNI33544.1 GguC protein [Alloacidobacterium dinghuense]
MRLVQLTHHKERLVALVDGEALHPLPEYHSIYQLAFTAIRGERTIPDIVHDAKANSALSYDAVYEGSSPWRLLPSFDHPEDSAHLTVSGTGLTHKASAENRAAMHKNETAVVTDSMRMYQLGMEGGHPAQGKIGVRPEWFYKGDGSVLRAHGEELVAPPYGDDGGEEPEIAGIYVIDLDGQPFRVGLTVGNEFADHVMERKNYLYLAPSKLRECSIGPELWVDCEPFSDIDGTVTIERQKETVWKAKIYSGENNMCHSVANLEHHHFKYALHRRPGDAHIHFFGADAFSFGDNVRLQDGDVMEISFPAFGRPLRNTLRISGDQDQFVRVKRLD